MKKSKRPPPPTLEQQMRREFRETLREIEGPLVEPTDDEKRNGWTAETLTAYLTEQKAAAALRIDPHSAMNRAARKPVRANSRYNPHRWR